MSVTWPSNPSWKSLGYCVTTGYTVPNVYTIYLDFQLSYYQDPKQNKTFFAVSAVKFRKAGGNFSYNGNCHVKINQNSTYPQKESVKATTCTINWSKGTSAESTFNLSGGHYWFYANGGGSFAAPLFYVTVTNDGGTNPIKFTNQGVTNLTSWTTPSIDRSSGTGTITYNSKTSNSINFSYSAAVETNLMQYRINNGSWTTLYSGTTAANTKRTLNITGLTGGTTYKIAARHRRSYNDVYSGEYSFSQMTKYPAAVYYNDNGTWRKAKAVWYNDNGTWRKAKAVYYNDNGTWRKAQEWI